MEEIKGYQIIYVLEDSLLLYKNFGVYRFQKETKKIDYLCSFLVDGKKRLLCASADLLTGYSDSLLGVVSVFLKLCS